MRFIAAWGSSPSMIGKIIKLPYCLVCLPIAETNEQSILPANILCSRFSAKDVTAEAGICFSPTNSLNSTLNPHEEIKEVQCRKRSRYLGNGFRFTRMDVPVSFAKRNHKGDQQ